LWKNAVRPIITMIMDMKDTDTKDTITNSRVYLQKKKSALAADFFLPRH
jgi:hypothetical protein